MLHDLFSELVAETNYNQLTVFDLNTKKEVGVLQVPADTLNWHLKQTGTQAPYRTYMARIHKFDNLQVCSYFVCLLENGVDIVWSHDAILD